MLDSNFWKNYFKVYDVLNLLIPYRELLETICDELEIKPGEKILEAGCGTGNLALKIKERGAEVVGLDNCKEALDIYHKKDPKAELVLADLAKKLPFPDSYFNKIASNNTLYAIPKEKQLFTLKELYRILKPRGKIVLTNPIKESKVFKIYITGIKESFKKGGVIFTIKTVFQLIPQTVKMFYFNSKIKSEASEGTYNFMKYEEQKNLLKTANFINILDTKLTYANQAILNTGQKPSI